MGKIIFSYGHDPMYQETEEVDITNWRALIEDSDEDKVTFVTEQCDEISISDVTVDEVHEINYCNKTVKKPNGLIVGSWLPCRHCAGSGLTDWISKTMSVPFRMERLEYDRNPKDEIINLDMLSLYLSLYTSTPKRLSSQEFCSFCHGCGLNLVRNFNIIKRFKIENC